MEDFFNVIEWLYLNNGVFGINHIVVQGRTYWLDDSGDRKKLYNLYKQVGHTKLGNICEILGTNEPIRILDSNGRLLYIENDDFWEKYTYDSHNNVIARENSTGYWIKYETDSYGHITYSIDSDGNYTMSNYIGLGNQSRYEAGTLIDGIKTVQQLEYKFYDADWNEIGYYLFPENTSEIFD